MSYEASCHCGAVAVEVDGAIPAQAIACNCSHCRRKGFLLTFVPKEQARVLRGENALTEHRFNKNAIAHRFCNRCGTQPFAEGVGPDGPTVMINLRCVPEADLNSLKIKQVDGASF